MVSAVSKSHFAPRQVSGLQTGRYFGKKLSGFPTFDPKLAKNRRPVSTTGRFLDRADGSDGSVRFVRCVLDTGQPDASGPRTWQQDATWKERMMQRKKKGRGLGRKLKGAPQNSCDWRTLSEIASGQLVFPTCHAGRSKQGETNGTKGRQSDAS